MTITCFHDDRIIILFEKASDNFLILKLANCSTHGGETWNTCIIHRFNDNQNNKYPQALFFKITFSLLKLANGTTHEDETWYACV